jgi:hypothetical protein
MKIESNDKRIDELLKGNTFVIPRFQRPYSWEPEQVSQFWSDLIENFGESYFIGSMVVYKLGKSSLAVVDGQQRLTTITIALCAIRDAFKSLKELNFAAGLQGYIEQKTRENESVYVLQTETSFPFLQEKVLKNGDAELDLNVGREEEAIERALRIFQDRISEQIDAILSNQSKSAEESHAGAVKWLSQLRDTVFDLNVIVVTLDNEDDAYLIFETLNTRGKDLALSDLIRNHFTKFLKPKSGVDHAVIKWSKVLDTIAGAPVNLDPDNFIVHSWQSRFDFVTKAKIFPKVRAEINLKNSKDHLDRFTSDAECWRSIFDTDFGWVKTEKEAARSLRALRIFKVVQPAPGLLSLIRAYKDGLLRYKHLRDALIMIEKFHFSFNAVTSSRSSGGISGMYSSFGRAVFNASTSDERLASIADLKTKLQMREPPSSEFNAGFEQIVFTNSLSSQKPLVQYILRKVSLHEGQPTIGDTDDLTIEHLLPQAKQGKVADERIIGQMGNLILVDGKTNGLLADKSFAQKKLILAERGYKLPELLLAIDEVTEEKIKENTLRLASLARETIWKI